jgi:hypothetical protein
VAASTRRVCAFDQGRRVSQLPSRESDSRRTSGSRPIGNSCRPMQRAVDGAATSLSRPLAEVLLSSELRQTCWFIGEHQRLRRSKAGSVPTCEARLSAAHRPVSQIATRSSHSSLRELGIDVQQNHRDDENSRHADDSWWRPACRKKHRGRNVDCELPLPLRSQLIVVSRELTAGARSHPLESGRTC